MTRCWMDTCTRYRLTRAYARTAVRPRGFCPPTSDADAIVGRGWQGPFMDQLLVLRCNDVRYLLVTHIYDHGVVSVDELVESLAWQGFAIRGRPSKTVSDALRTDVKIGRVIRRGRGRYGPGVMARATEYRIGRRVQELRAQVAALTAEGGRAA